MPPFHSDRLCSPVTFFTFSADESTDRSTKKLLLTYVYWVKHGVLHSALLALTDLKADGTARSIADTLRSVLVRQCWVILTCRCRFLSPWLRPRHPAQLLPSPCPAPAQPLASCCASTVALQPLQQSTHCQTIHYLRRWSSMGLTPPS